MGRLTVLLLLAVLLSADAAQASYLHAGDAARVVTHEAQADVRKGVVGSFAILSTERRNAHGVDVWVRLLDVQGEDPSDRITEITWLEHVRLYPNGIVTSHRDGFDYRYRERLPR